MLFRTKPPGPSLRISPTEVHLSNSHNYSEIYSSSYKYPKDPGFYNAMEGPIRAPVLLTVKSSDEHRVRRAALNPFFSRRSVLELEQIIKTKMENLCGMIQACLYDDESFPSTEMMVERKGKGNNIFDNHNAIHAYAMDIITEYAYGISNCWNQLDQLADATDYQEAIRVVQLLFPWFQTFPGLMTACG